MCYGHINFNEIKKHKMEAYMNFTGYKFEGKTLASLSVGCMRFPNRQAAEEIISTCVKNNAVYLDTSPGYCYQSEEENCETWVGSAIKGIRDKVILSAKCATGNGGDKIGNYDPAHGFSITTESEVRKQIEQSLKRLNVDSLDFYQLWAVHNYPLYEVALKKGGWLDGVLKAKDEGLLKHIGFTGHIGSDDIIKVIDNSNFEMITIPFNIMDNSRLKAVKYAREKNIAVVMMNPLAGGILGENGNEAILGMLKKVGEDSLQGMSLSYCAAFNSSALSGMSSNEQALHNVEVFSKPLIDDEKASLYKKELESVLHHESFKCTSCGYCTPCPQGINIPEVLRMRNNYLIFGLQDAKNRLKNAYKSDAGFRVENCTECGLCESKCPNGVNTIELLKDALKIRNEA
jgi:predicted aldo/keto reductase-like oxidoreductase